MGVISSLQTRQRHETDERLDEITPGVEDEIARFRDSSCTRPFADATALPTADSELLSRVLGPNYTARFDSVDIAQLAHTIAVCRTSETAADAAKKLFAVSRKAKTSSISFSRFCPLLVFHSREKKGRISRSCFSGGLRMPEMSTRRECARLGAFAFYVRLISESS